MNRIQSIDIVKILARCMVVTMHLALARGEAGFAAVSDVLISPLTGVAMPLFFMVSGYLMCRHNGNMGYAAQKIWHIVRFCFIVCTTLTRGGMVQDGRVPPAGAHGHPAVGLLRGAGHSVAHVLRRGLAAHAHSPDAQSVPDIAGRRKSRCFSHSR